MACKECHGYVQRRETHCGGIQPLYCSDACRLSAKRRFYREWRLRNLERERLRDRVQTLTQRERRRKAQQRRYSANKESIKAEARARRRADPARSATADRKWRQSHPEVARNKNRRCHTKRRAVLKGVFVEPVNHQVVFDRDKGRCGICKKPVARDSNWEIDHVIPVSRGGAHAYANVQLAHAACNRRKSDKLPVGQPTLFQVAV